MRFLGPNSVRGLPALITEQSTKVDRIVGLVADLGDDGTEAEGIGKTPASPSRRSSTHQVWFEKQRVMIQKADDDSKQKVTKDQLQGAGRSSTRIRG